MGVLEHQCFDEVSAHAVLLQEKIGESVDALVRVFVIQEKVGLLPRDVLLLLTGESVLFSQVLASLTQIFRACLKEHLGEGDPVGDLQTLPQNFRSLFLLF